jgi:DnaJ-class molecular chaperone
MINGDCDPFVRARDPMNKIDRYDRSAAPTSGKEVVTNIPDYYKLLELDRSASQQAIGDAYRYFAKRCHPATQKNTDVGARERNSRLFVLYNEAYEVLGNTKSRAVYDFYGTSPCSIITGKLMYFLFAGGEAARNGICRETFDYREGAYNRNNAQNPEDCFRKYNYDHSPLPKVSVFS